MDLRSIDLRSLQNVRLYNATDQLLGRASEIILPQPERTFAKHGGLGLASSIEVPGPWKQPFAIFVEANIGTLELSIHPVRLTCRCQLRDCITNYGYSDDNEVLSTMTGNFSREAQHSNRVKLGLQYFQLRIGTTEIEVFDAFENIWRKRGKDLIYKL